MKISIYALHLSFGGVEKYVATLANMLCVCHDVEIVSTYKIDEKPAFAIDPRVKVTYLLEGLKPNKEEIKKAVRSKNPVEIFRQGIIAVRVLFAKKSANVKSLKTCNSDVIISTRAFHNALIGKYAPNAVKITGEHNHHNNNKEYVDGVIYSCKGFDYFIPISKELCDYYREPMNGLGVETKYIKFCIDANPDYKDPSFDECNIISVGRLSHEKGYADLIDMFESVAAKNERAKLHIVGDGNERANLDALIAEKNLQDRVVMHGFKDKKYIYDLLSKASVYAMASHTESFGLVLLEAMSCGIPCVAFSSAQGAHEIITNGENGYLVENRDKKAMADIICEMLSDKEKLRQISTKALETANEFSYEKTQAAWLDLMNEIEKEKRTKK